MDGNGRTGRLWQTALLASWKPIFEWIPIESIIKDNQEEYYRAIGLSTAEDKSNRFILFMLGVIKKAVSELARDARNHQSHISNQLRALMSVIETCPHVRDGVDGTVGLKIAGDVPQKLFAARIGSRAYRHGRFRYTD